MHKHRRILVSVSLLVLLSFATIACGNDENTLTLYSGRTENLIQPLLDDFTEVTGIEVDVRYGQSADLALLIDTEGDQTPADVYISQSPGAMDFLAGKNRLTTLPSTILSLTDAEFRSDQGWWTGMSGRVRVIVYNQELISPEELPDSVFELTDPRYRGQIAVAPANGSFQDFVTAMRQAHGDDAALQWLQGLVANDAQTYSGNTPIVQAVGRGEVPFGLVNHYYNYRALAEDPDVPSRNYWLPSGDVGSFMLLTAIGVINNSDNQEDAEELVRFMLSRSAQSFFASQTFEYPLAAGVAPSGILPSLESIGITTYDFEELGGGLERTKELIDQSGLEAA